jgi:hypothetical protein
MSGKTLAQQNNPVKKAESTNISTFLKTAEHNYMNIEFRFAGFYNE